MPADPELIAYVRGDLPDEIVDYLDWDRLAAYAKEAVLGQHHETRTPLLEDGIVRFHATPFDEEGFTTVSVAGEHLVRVHFTRLFPGPLELEDMELAEPRKEKPGVTYEWQVAKSRGKIGAGTEPESRSGSPLNRPERLLDRSATTL